MYYFKMVLECYMYKGLGIIMYDRMVGCLFKCDGIWIFIGMVL